MKRVLFVSNGHGEVAIAARISAELQDVAGSDHLALVGDFAHSGVMRDVGPRRRMPSGGLIAMGNLRNIARDLRAGLIGHTLAQLRFLNGCCATYAAAVAVGDVFALGMALRTRIATAFVGTAKSVYVAPYGSFEESVIRKAAVVYVRDEPTAQRLQAHGIPARSGNVIVDLYTDEAPPVKDEQSPYLALFPGSREDAYGAAALLAGVVHELAQRFAQLGAVLSIAPGLEHERMKAAIAGAGFDVAEGGAHMPFRAFLGEREVLRAWTGPIGAMLAGADAVLGQAGTANEAAAAAGIPVIAFASNESGKHAWYRMRQAGLLGDALLVVAGDESSAAQQVAALLADPDRRAKMAQAGRARMGPPGAAKQVAAAIAELIA